MKRQTRNKIRHTEAVGKAYREKAQREAGLGVTLKTLRLCALNGALVPVYGGQGKRRAGYTEQSVRTILAGKGGHV